MEYVVTLHATNGPVYTCYPESKMEDAITLWREYIFSGKKATLTVEGVEPK